MKRILLFPLLLCLSFLLTACGGGVKIVLPKGDEIAMKSDRTVWKDGKQLGSISEDFQVFDPSGKMIAELKEEQLKDPDGEVLGAIDKDGDMQFGVVALIWADGSLMNEELPLKVSRIPSNTKLPREASILFVMDHKKRWEE
ncbi:MAG: hypothetical protein AAF585_28100 [Verrucomicrobiota bacterium]